MSAHKPLDNTSTSGAGPDAVPSAVKSGRDTAPTFFDKLNTFVDHGQAVLSKRRQNMAVALWTTLWRFENRKSGTVRVSARKLAEALGVGRTTVRASMKVLKELGYVREIEAGKPGNGGRCGVYQLFALPSEGSSATLKGSVSHPLADCPQRVAGTPSEGSSATLKGSVSHPLQGISEQEQKNKEEKPPLPPAKPGGGGAMQSAADPGGNAWAERLADLIAAWVAARLPGHDAAGGIQETSNRRGLWQMRLSDEAWRSRWRAAVERAGRSAACRGEDPKFMVHGLRLDTFLKEPDIVARITEGEFDDATTASGSGVGATRAAQGGSSRGSEPSRYGHLGTAPGALPAAGGLGRYGHIIDNTGTPPADAIKSLFDPPLPVQSNPAQPGREFTAKEILNVIGVPDAVTAPPPPPPVPPPPPPPAPKRKTSAGSNDAFAAILKLPLAECEQAIAQFRESAVSAPDPPPTEGGPP